jgi:hypothetical protein
MQTEFRLKRNAIEVWFNGKFRATIIPGDDNQPVMKVISNHLSSVDERKGPVFDEYQFNFFTD